MCGREVVMCVYASHSWLRGRWLATLHAAHWNMPANPALWACGSYYDLDKAGRRLQSSSKHLCDNWRRSLACVCGCMGGWLVCGWCAGGTWVVPWCAWVRIGA